MVITLNTEDICRLFYNSHHIPVGIFCPDGSLGKMYYNCGARIARLYLEAAQKILKNERQETSPLLFYDSSGSAWCRIPFKEKTILIGPVQTGRNPLFPYDGIPDHTWNDFHEAATFFVSLLFGKEIPLIESEDTYTNAYTAGQMSRPGHSDEGYQPFDELFSCVATGDLPRLNIILSSGEFRRYQDRVMTNMQTARTVFQFNLAKTYHSAQQSQASLGDLVPLVNLYLSEASGYQTIAAYKAGTERMLYDFTKYVSQYSDEGFSPLINQAILYIRENIYTTITVEDVAAHCLVSLSTLQHRFKKETGMSIKEKIRELKIERACFFLRNTKLSCSDIAFRLGYGSQSYFIKQFRTIKGITPAEYK